MQRMRLNIGVGVLFAVAAMLFAVIPAPHAAAETANVLKVSPVRSDITMNPGESKTVQVTVTNVTKGDISVRPIENDFVAGDERGTPAIILDTDKYAPTHSLKRFMVPLQDVTIPAGKAATINVVINVPKDAQAGGYFGALRFAPTTPDSGGQVNLSASAASLILLTVSGPVSEQLSMTEFNITQDGKAGEFFNTSNDMQVAVRFANQGNIQLAPWGKVSVKQGDKLVYETDFNSTDPKDMILPDSARRWDIPLKKLGSFGHYTVSATFTYGSKNQTIEVTKSFWVVPMVVIIATVVGVLVLLGLIVAIWLFLRSYKRRILRKHKGGSGLRRF